MSICCDYCVSGIGLCDELITRPEESYRLWCVVVLCDLENLLTEETLAHWGGGCRAENKQKPLKHTRSYLYHQL